MCLLYLGMREIKALPITCNIDKECEWEGTLGTLEKHVANCDFVLCPCPKQCTVDESKVVGFIRKDLDEHLKNHCPNRDHECSDCGEKGTYANITQDHDMVCSKKPLPCPNAGCGDIVERQQVPEHVSKCPHTVIPCKYKGIGCDVKLERKDMAAHEQDDKLHLHMALDTVTSQQDAIASLRDTTRQQEETIESLQDTTWQQEETILAVQHKIKRLLKQQEQLPGTFAMLGYQKRKETKARFSSPSFYTSPNGYHVQVKVDASGQSKGEDTHVSIFVHILEGKYDSRLKWPFVGQVTVTLLNQLENDNHHTKNVVFVSRDNKVAGNSWGKATFISHHKLAHDPVKNTQYLKDDTLYFRVRAEVDDHRPWLECTIK